MLVTVSKIFNKTSLHINPSFHIRYSLLTNNRMRLKCCIYNPLLDIKWRTMNLPDQQCWEVGIRGTRSCFLDLSKLRYSMKHML